MKKFALALTAALVASVGLAPVAHAAEYGQSATTFSVSDSTVHGGESFTVTASNNTPPNGCDTYTATFNGASQTGSGTTFSATFTAPTVKKRTVFPVSLTCTINGSSSTQTTNISVLPTRHSQGAAAFGGSGTLPNTGGPRIVLLSGAVALLLGGFGFMVASRRRRAEIG